MSAPQNVPREHIATVIRAHAKGDPALVAYLTAGYPSKALFTEHLRAVASAADVVEIGVPFTDPMADGVTIQRSSQGALEQGVSLRWILAELAAMPKVSAPLLLMSYLNPLLALGADRLPQAAAKAGSAASSFRTCRWTRAICSRMHWPHRVSRSCRWSHR